MLKDNNAFSSFSVDDLDKAKEFYGNTLGVEVEETPGMGVTLKLAGGGRVFIYNKDDHQPATYTILNFSVEDIDKTVEELKAKDIKLLDYDLGNSAKTDESGVMRGLATKMGPDIAWFKDPAGNILAVLQEK